MKNSKSVKFLPIILLLLVTTVACNSSGSGKSEDVVDPVGDWEYMVTTDVSRGVISISGNPGAYKASMTTEVFGTLELMDLEIEGNALNANLDVGGTAAKIQLQFDGDKIEGAVTAGEDKFPFEGKRAGK